MRFSVDKEHRHQFEQERMIEFDSLMKPSLITDVNKAIDQALARRLAIPASLLGCERAECIMAHGRDLWRDAEPVRHLATQYALAKAAAELLLVQGSMRLGYDQLFIALDEPPQAGAQVSYFRPNGQHISLEDISCVQGILGAVMLCIQAPIAVSIINMPTIFSHVAGAGVFFAPDLPIDWNALTRQRGGRHLLIAYTHESSVYIRQQEDPCCHVLKKWGMTFGDRLTEKTHPTILRSHC